MKHKEARLYILLSLLIASVIVGVIMHGPRLLAYMSEKSGFHAAKEENDYALVPITLGRAALHALIADTEDRRMLGLSYRHELAEDVGMLFIFDNVGRHGIWMKDMKFPIDIIWFDKYLRAIYIRENVDPDTFPEVFEPFSDDRYILEVNAGFVKKNDIHLDSELIIYR